MAITNQQTLRDTIADWLNRGDLTNNQIDSFISAGESKIYDVLRIPPLETSTDFTLTPTYSSITIPSDFLEAIELRKINEDGSSDIYDTVLKRVDSRTLFDGGSPRVPNSFARELGNFVITGSSGEIANSGTYKLKYYRYLTKIGEKYDLGAVFNTDSETCSSLVDTTYDSDNSECTITSNNVEVLNYFILGDPDIVLYASLWVASEFLNDDEGSARYSKLFFDKVDFVSRRSNKSEMSGGNVTVKLPVGIG